MVVPDDVLVQRLHERIVVLVIIFVAVEHLLLQKAEEVLGHRVVEAVSLPRHRLSYAVVAEPRLVRLHLILPALIGVQNGLSPSYDSRLLQLVEHVQRLSEVRMLRDAVADHHAVAEVDDGRQIDFAERELELRDVRSHLEAHLRGLEVAVQQIRADLADVAPVRVVFSASEGRLVADVPENPPDLVPAHPDAHLGQGYDDSS